MNINLGIPAHNGLGPSLQDEIDESREIVEKAGFPIGGRTLLLSDPEYPGAYRVWFERTPARRGQDPTWVWITPDGDAIQTQRPWAVD